MKSFDSRLRALEALKRERADRAIDLALGQLSRDEAEAFWRYWRRSKGRNNVFPGGDEVAAVARYEALVTAAY